MLRSFLLIPVLTVFAFSTLFAEKDIVLAEPVTGAADEPAQADDKESETELPLFEEHIQDFEFFPGLFDIYRNTEKDEYFLALHPDQLEVIYLLSITRQTGDAGSFDSGAMMGSLPMVLHKFNKSIQLRRINTRFRAENNPPMERALDNALNPSIILTTDILTEPDTLHGKILIDLKKLFLNDRFTQIGYITGEWKRKYQFDQDNSRFNSLKSFPLNTEIDVLLHFKSDKPHRSVTLPDSRSMLHRYHFSLSALPESDYVPRPADDRVGYFLTMYQDYSTVEQDSPYKYLINRWNLKKKDPNADLSPPVKPITFWLENTIPIEYRPAIEQAILLWNDAFERIGYQDAVVVKQMPDDADWDPADVRYNTIRWIIQPGGGYAVGPSRANPFTGEIYDADIRISADFVRHFYTDVAEMIAPLSLSEVLSEARLESEHRTGRHECRYAAEKAHQMSFAWDLLAARGLTDNMNREQFINDGLIDLVVHEVGHTLGLRHNFKGSHVYPEDLLQDKQFTENFGLTSSVMDYAPLNISLPGDSQGSYFQTALGVWDYWVIEYGYGDAEYRGFDSEDTYLEHLAGMVAEPMLDYCTDEDARGYSAWGMDPSCSLYDLTSNPLEYYQTRVDLVHELWQGLPDNSVQPGGEYQDVRNVFFQGIREYRNLSRNVPKYIGGVYVYRGHIGDHTEKWPYEAVPAAEQREALAFLNKVLFSADAFEFSPELLSMLTPEYRGDFYGGLWRSGRQDVPIHSEIRVIQAGALVRLYSAATLERLLDNEIRYRREKEVFTMAELFETLRDNIWNELDSGSNIISFRRELQRMHLKLLQDIILEKPDKYPLDAVALARYDLLALGEKIPGVIHRPGISTINKAHLQEVKASIEGTLEAHLSRD